MADIESHKKLSPIVTKLLLRRRKLNIMLVFISQSYFKVPKTKRLNATHYFIMKISNERELQQIASTQLANIGLQDVPRTSLTIKILFDHPGDFSNWPPGCFGMMSTECPNLTSKGCLWEVDLRHP